MTALYVICCIIVILGLSAFFGAPYVPTRRQDLRRMFDQLAPIGEQDVVLDIGSGDGLVLREVSKRCARAVGYEIHPFFLILSRIFSWGDTRVRVRWANAWNAAFPHDVTLVYVFAVGRDGKRLSKKVQHEANVLGRPVSLVCYGNPLPGQTPVKVFEAYYLYRFEPLHPDKA